MINVLYKLGMTSKDGKIKVWNLALFVVLIKMAIDLSWIALPALLLLLLNHNVDKYLKVRKAEKLVGDMDRLENLEKEIKSLHQAINLKNLGR